MVATISASKVADQIERSDSVEIIRNNYENLVNCDPYRDVLIAEVDGEWTMKYFRKAGKQIILEAANPKYPDIRPRTELRLGGVVTAVIRKYHV